MRNNLSCLERVLLFIVVLFLCGAIYLCSPQISVKVTSTPSAENNQLPVVLVTAAGSLMTCLMFYRQKKDLQYTIQHNQRCDAKNTLTKLIDNIEKERNICIGNSSQEEESKGDGAFKIMLYELNCNQTSEKTNIVLEKHKREIYDYIRSIKYFVVTLTNYQKNKMLDEDDIKDIIMLFRSLASKYELRFLDQMLIKKYPDFNILKIGSLVKARV